MSFKNYITNSGIINKDSRSSLNINNILTIVCAAVVLFWVLIYSMSGVVSNRSSSFLFCALSGGSTLFVLTKYFERYKILNKNATQLILFAYVFRLLFGVIHFLLIFDDNYFGGTAEYAYLDDYTWLHTSMLEVVNYWEINGFGAVDPIFFAVNKNPIITEYMSLMYYLGRNDHYLNIVIINSFHTILVAIVVSTSGFLFGNTGNANKILLLTLLQPFGIASSIFWRDAVGQLFIIFSILLLMNIRWNIKGLLLAGISLLLSFSARSVYLLINSTIGLKVLFYSVFKTKIKISMSVVLVSIILLFLIVGRYVSNLSNLMNSFGSQDYSNHSAGFGSLYIVLKGLSGPFPWQQIFDKDTQGKEYLLNDMLQATYSLVIYFYLINQFLSKSYLNFNRMEKNIIITVLFYVFFGLLSYGHISYTTVVSVLLLSVFRELTVRNFLVVWAIFILFFIISSLVWELF